MPQARSAERAEARVTTASWVVWAAAAVIMAPAYVIISEAEPHPGWGSVAALSIAAVVATIAGHRAGRWFESRYPDPAGIDPRTVREATLLASLGCGMASNEAWRAVLPSWTLFVIALIVLLAALGALLLRERTPPSGP